MITHPSRDNFPNTFADPSNPYGLLNSPAIGDLFDPFARQHDEKDA
ncbi:MAG TPA: hypothetical protein VK456_04700 [Xanthobacteraceae bacterium]|nr:hypothetical protein [Xanthobacteraceae bacterium]